jgi:hypothetical protein
MDRGKLVRHGHLVIAIRDLDVARVPLAPSKADAPLIVDPDAVFSYTISGELSYSSALRRYWQDGVSVSLKSALPSGV